MDVILEVIDLKKAYGKLLAVDGISFSVRRGSFFAFLGPNGAGKTTTLNIISTLLDANSGQVTLNGKSEEDYFRKKIGVVFQTNVLDDNLTVKENLLMRGALYINNKKAVLERYKDLADKLNLREFETKRLKALSGGQKRRAEIARALFANPEILLLDEPTTGLDPETRQVVWNVIDDLKNNSGMTIFLTTHYMEEAAKADHVVIINKGRVETEGTPAFLKDKYSHDRLKIVPKNKTLLIEQLNEIGIKFVKVSDEYIIKVESVENIIKLLEKLKDNIRQFEVIKGSMDDVFLEVIGGKNHV